MVNKNESVINLIPIFQGKKGSYNRLVLEVLAEAKEPLKPWELAKRIHEKEPKEVDWYRGTQKIYSILIRKGGRLEELEKKDYITFRNGKWELTFKGLITALIVNPQLKSKVLNRFKRVSNFLLMQLPETHAPREIPLGRLAILGIKMDGEKLKKLLEVGAKVIAEDGEQLIDFTVRETKDLINNGLDLDRITTQKLNMLLGLKRFLFLDDRFTQLLDKLGNKILRELEADAPQGGG